MYLEALSKVIRSISWRWLRITTVPLSYAEVTGIAPVEAEPPVSGDAAYAIVHYYRADGDYGDHTTGDYNDFWGLHLWGDGIDPVKARNGPVRNRF